MLAKPQKPPAQLLSVVHNGADLQPSIAFVDDFLILAQRRFMQVVTGFAGKEDGGFERHYLPQMADESRRKYLFVAIDRATR